jgi:hypothetical protein
MAPVAAINAEEGKSDDTSAFIRGFRDLRYCASHRACGVQSATALALAAHFLAATRGCANHANDPRGVARAANVVPQTVGATALALAAHFLAATRGCANHANDPRGVARAANVVFRDVGSLRAPREIGGQSERDGHRNKGCEGQAKYGSFHL